MYADALNGSITVLLSPSVCRASVICENDTLVNVNSDDERCQCSSVFCFCIGSPFSIKKYGLMLCREAEDSGLPEEGTTHSDITPFSAGSILVAWNQQ